MRSPRSPVWPSAIGACPGRLRRPGARLEDEGIPDPDALLALVDAIYAAAFEPSRWSVALPLLVRALHAERGFLGFTSTVRGRTISSVAHEFDPEFLNRWQGEFGGSDPWYDRGGNLPTGQVV